MVDWKSNAELAVDGGTFPSSRTRAPPLRAVPASAPAMLKRFAYF